MRIVVLSAHAWYDCVASQLSPTCEVLQLNVLDAAAITAIKAFAPRYIFIPHWSSKIPAEIYAHYETIIFHMTDLPFGRGGSPLQNLISRGIYETKVSALRCSDELDAGPIYLKSPLSLHGAAEEIYLRLAKVIAQMALEITTQQAQPVEQTGEVSFFPRRLPEQSNMAGLASLEALFDHIRMLDATGYPAAFVDVGPFRLQFSRAQLSLGKVSADVSISLKPKEQP